MGNSTFTIIIAACVALAVFGVMQIVTVLLKGEKRKLSQRLSSEQTHEVSSTQRSITQIEATGLSAQLIEINFFGWLHKRILQAYPEMTLTRFLSVSFIIMFALGGVVFLVSNSPVPALVAAALGLYIPFLLVSTKRSKRQRLLADQLPEALDFLSRVMRAGHSLTTGLQMMGQELPMPLAMEFRRCYDQHSLGQPLEESLKDVARRVESTDFAFFVTAILIQRQTGGDLSEVLNNISGMIRQRIRLQQHVKAKTAEGRLTGYILTAFPAVMFVLAYMMNPQYGGMLLTTTTGRTLLGVAFGLQMLGLFAIRKITTIKV